MVWEENQYEGFIVTNQSEVRNRTLVKKSQLRFLWKGTEEKNWDACLLLVNIFAGHVSYIPLFTLIIWNTETVVLVSYRCPLDKAQGYLSNSQLEDFPDQINWQPGLWRNVLTIYSCKKDCPSLGNVIFEHVVLGFIRKLVECNLWRKNMEQTGKQCISVFLLHFQPWLPSERDHDL